MKYTSGFVIDRFVGNTGGLTSFDGLLEYVGEGPSKLKYVPIGAAVKQFFSRTKKVIESIKYAHKVVLYFNCTAN